MCIGNISFKPPERPLMPPEAKRIRRAQLAAQVSPRGYRAPYRDTAF